MKWAVAFTLLGVLFTVRGATPVYLPTDQVTGQPLTNVTVRFTPLSYQSYSNRLVTKVPSEVKTDSAGIATNNLIAGTYRIEVDHYTVTTTWTNCVGETNIAVNLADPANMCGGGPTVIQDARYPSAFGTNIVPYYVTNGGVRRLVIAAAGGGSSSGGSATNAIGKGYTNGVLAGTGLTEIGFSDGSNTTARATVAGGRMTVTIQARTTTVSAGNGIWITNQGGTNFVVAGEVTAAQLAAVATLITNYVAGLGYVTASVTNGLAGKNYVDATFAPINAPTFTGDAIFGGPAQFLSDLAVGGAFSTELTTGTGPYVGYDQANQTFFRTNVPPVGFQVASNGSMTAGSTVTTNLSYDSTQDVTPTVTSNQQSVAVSQSFTGGRTGSGAVMKADSPTGTNGTFKGTVSGAPMTLQPLPGTTNGTLRMMDTNGVVLSLVDSNGNWGIKTTAPTAALDVNGGARFRSGLTNDAASMKFPASTAGYVLTDTTGSGLLTLQPAGIGSGEANVTGEISVTNDAVYRFGLTYDKSGVTNRLRSIQAGYGMTGTNQGTNLVFAVDIAVIASQANLTAASNALHAIILSASNGVYLASAANDITTSNGLHSILISSSNALNSLIVASSNSLRSTFTAADITTSNGVLTAATAVVNLASNFVWSYANTSSNAFWTLNGVTSNGVYSAAVAVVNLASNALVTLYRADDITTSNGVLTASTVIVNLASNVLRTDITALQTMTNALGSRVTGIEGQTNYWVSRYRTNFSQASISFPCIFDMDVSLTNALAGNVNFTFTSLKIGSRGCVRLLSDGSARTITVLAAGATRIPMATNNLALPDGTNAVTVASKRAVLYYDVSQGAGDLTNFNYWFFVQKN